MGPKNCEAQWSSPASMAYGLALAAARVLWIESFFLLQKHPKNTLKR